MQIYIVVNNPFFYNSSVYLRQDNLNNWKIIGQTEEFSKYSYEEVRVLHIYISQIYCGWCFGACKF